MLYSNNEQNTVNQLHFNKKNKLKKEENRKLKQDKHGGGMTTGAGGDDDGRGEGQPRLPLFHEALKGQQWSKTKSSSAGNKHATRERPLPANIN